MVGKLKVNPESNKTPRFLVESHGDTGEPRISKRKLCSKASRFSGVPTNRIVLSGFNYFIQPCTDEKQCWWRGWIWHCLGLGLYRGYVRHCEALDYYFT